MDSVTQVVPSNLSQQMDAIREKLASYPNICIDTEFKRFKRAIEHDTCEEDKIYQDLKYNINCNNLREVGLTLTSNDGVVGGTWRFDTKPSKKAGIKRKDCVSFDEFGSEFEKLLDEEFKGRVKWVMFSGYYDMAHLVALVTKKALPNSMDEFVELVGRRFGRVYDLKVVAKGYDNFGNNKYLGLEKLASMIGVKRVGEEHDAASDSLVTACVFAKFMNLGWVSEDSNEGFLYLLPKRIRCIPSSKDCSSEDVVIKDDEVRQVIEEIIYTFSKYCSKDVVIKDDEVRQVIEEIIYIF